MVETQGRPIEERRRRVMGLPQAPEGQRRGVLRRWPHVLAILVVVGAFGFLGFNAFKSASMYYLTPSELLAKGEDAYNDEVRLSGTVVDGTIERDADNVLRFTVADDSVTIPVVYQGVVPDTFKEGAEVVVEGELGAGRIFEASSLLAKCPSKYEPESEG